MLGRRTFNTLLAGAAAAVGLPSLTPSFMPAARAAPGLKREGPDAIANRAQHDATMLFWECGHPVSGLIGDRIRFRREGEPGGDGNRSVVAGASGFGIMALLGAVDQGWLTREEVCGRVGRIAAFLKNAETWHGMFPHQMDGETGATLAFDGPDDTGGDTVETAFLMMGLLSARQFFDRPAGAEADLRRDIDTLWHAVDWQAYVRFQYDRDHLFWRLSPRVEQKLAADPYSPQTHASAAEGTAALLMAAMSPTHPIPHDLVRESLDRAEQFRNGRRLYGVTLPMGPADGGDLFYWAYIASAFDPRGMRYRDIAFDLHMRNHARINQAYAESKGHGPLGWLISACDGPDGGYRARSIASDDGTFNPPMAMAYYAMAPEACSKALRALRDEGLWGRYGPVSAVNPHYQWRARDIVSLDVLAGAAGMANASGGTVWKRFMQAPEIRSLSGLVSSPWIDETPVVAQNLKPYAL